MFKDNQKNIKEQYFGQKIIVGSPEFVINDLEAILDAIYELYEQQQKIVIVTSNYKQDQIQAAANKLQASVISNKASKLPPSTGIALIFDTDVNSQLLKTIESKNIGVISFKELKNKLHGLNVRFYSLPSFDNSRQENIRINLLTLPIAFQSVKGLYLKQIEQEMNELVELTLNLKEANSRANKALDRALVEIKETRQMLGNLN